jgi:predicted Zn finger-like uncharacterized protein
MFTQCPKCALTLAVTAADLRVAQGYVRCGRCANVFNALHGLSDERKESATAFEFDPHTAKIEEVFVAPPISDSDPTGTFETIVMEGGQLENDTDRELTAELDSLAEKIAAKNRAAAQRLDTQVAQEQSLAATTVPESNGPPPHRPRAKFDWAWYAGSFFLVLWLAVQVMHYFREDLALHPQLNPALTKIYSTLGINLRPDWDLTAYEIKQLGAFSDVHANNRLIVRASIKNNAIHSQPLPILRVAVQDRFGNPVAQRDVIPALYLPQAQRAPAPLGQGERVDVEMRFVDPGKDAVGFEIDACLLGSGDNVNCANR